MRKGLLVSALVLAFAAGLVHAEPPAGLAQPTLTSPVFVRLDAAPAPVLDSKGDAGSCCGGLSRAAVLLSASG